MREIWKSEEAPGMFGQFGFRSAVFGAGLALLGAVALVTSPARANVVVNGDFSVDNVVAPWIQNTNFSYVGSGVYNMGSQGFEGTLSQVLVNSPGLYLLSYDYGANGGGGTSFFDVFIDGVQVPGAQNNGNAVAVQTFSFQVVLGPNATLLFQERNDPSYDSLDNVSLNPIPEPASLALLGAGLLGLVAARRRTAG